MGQGEPLGTFSATGRVGNQPPLCCTFLLLTLNHIGSQAAEFSGFLLCVHECVCVLICALPGSEL